MDDDFSFHYFIVSYDLFPAEETITEKQLHTGDPFRRGSCGPKLVRNSPLFAKCTHWNSL